MSFKIYLGSFRAGEGSTFPIDIVERAFGKYVEAREPTCWALAYPDGTGCEVYIRAAPKISGFMVARPINASPFADALFEVLSNSAGVIYWPGGGCVVADAAVIPQLPNDMITSLGMPTVVKSGHEIFDCIARSGRIP